MNDKNPTTRPRVGIIRYRSGNLASVSNALDRLGVDYLISDRSSELESCRSILFPGVGHAASAMQDLRERGLDEWIRSTGKPVLGICLGMQLLYEGTEEGDTETLGVIPGRLRKFDPAGGKVPHMGWNSIHKESPHPLLEEHGEHSYYYFVHSYYAPVNEYTVASSDYGIRFAAISAKENFLGVQFHPEKSADNGMAMLRRFLDLTNVNPES
jgi:imidazole glycerol-phosphate synthase subunit HisH